MMVMLLNRRIRALVDAGGIMDYDDFLLNVLKGNGKELTAMVKAEIFSIDLVPYENH